MKKSLGQNFLINKKAINDIVAALDLKKGDFVVEIGPGEGALTWPLARKCADLGCKLLAIEKDEQLVDKLLRVIANNANWPQQNNANKLIDLVAGDALELIPKLQEPNNKSQINSKFQIPNSSWKLVGNIPYYITGHLLRIIGELENKPSLTVLMVQKEVAERVTAKPPKMNPAPRGAKCGMNLLAAATQIWADVSMLFTLKPKDFVPRPKVDSAVIKMATEYEKSNEYTKTELDNYYKTIKIVFKQPRKTLINNLMTMTTKNDDDKRTKKEKLLAILRELGFDEKTRGQDLTIEELIDLSERLIL